MQNENSTSDVEPILKERERTIMEELKRATESHVPPKIDGSIGRLTHIDAHQQHQIALHGQRQLEQQLGRIQGALMRVKNGTYGACVRCGTAIGPGRLEFAPETPYCIPCQERLEREGRA
jgi:DnaK suppressor protein